MLYSVRGPLLFTDGRTAAVECGGVGYLCMITANTARQLPPVGQEALLFTVLNVREDAVDLFGFADKGELACFRQLITVSGVGPKVALAVLSEFSPERVAMAVSQGDFKTLTRAAGVGPKVAQRIVLELKDKLGVAMNDVGVPLSSAPQGVPSASSNAEEAVKALTVLGFTAGEASEAVARLDGSLPVDQLVRQALKSLGRR